MRLGDRNGHRKLRCDAQDSCTGWDQAQRIARKPQMAPAAVPPRLCGQDDVTVDTRGSALALSMIARSRYADAPPRSEGRPEAST